MTENEPKLKASREARTPWGLLALVIAAGAIVYVNSFPGVFFLDDLPGIVENDDVHDFNVANLRRGRPLTNFTLALNHRFGALDVRGYHAVNLLVHLLAACTLFGLVRRTLLLPGTRGHFATGAKWVAFAISLLWVVHPLLTESVTYIIQRSAAMAGLFYLLTLYCIARGAGSRRGAGWYACAVAACGLGMGSKAVVITAPLVAILYDRIFIASSFAEIVRARWALYAGLVATWGVLVYSGVLQGIFFPGDAAANMGFGYDGITPTGYLVSQPGVILHYLRLALWPAPLCVDYWWLPATTSGRIMAPALGVLVLVGATVVALFKWPRLGFLGAAFFVVLIPTSSFIPMRDLAFEHRMYLPLAAVLALPVLGIHRLLSAPGGSRLAPAAMLVLLLVAAGLGVGTIMRNSDYHSEEQMWRDVMTKRPQNPRAAHNLGSVLADEGRPDEALEAFRIALEFPDFRDTTYLSIGRVQASAGRINQAIDAYVRAVAGNPDRTSAQHALANLLVARGQANEALPYFRVVVNREPENADAHADFGRALASVTEFDKAAVELELAAELQPLDAQVQNNLGGVYALQGRPQIALERVIEAVRLDPTYEEAIDNLAKIMVRAADPDAIVARYRDKVDLNPALAKTYANRGDLALKDGRTDQAIQAYERALQITPDLEQARAGLAKATSQGQ